MYTYLLKFGNQEGRQYAYFHICIVCVANTSLNIKGHNLQEAYMKGTDKSLAL
jgi:hypothetical protein